MTFLYPLPDAPDARARHIANLAAFYAGAKLMTPEEPPTAKPEPKPLRAVRRTSDGREFASAAEAQAVTGCDAQVIRTTARRAERQGQRASWEYVAKGVA